LALEKIMSATRASSFPMQRDLAGAEATMALGAELAAAMIRMDSYPALLLDGELGAGKTTLVRGLVEALPGGGRAEVASPSFNYMNNYPTTPETVHIDLYRLRDLEPDDDLLQALHDPDCLVIVEWARYCPDRYLPENRLAVELSMHSQGRRVRIAPRGTAAEDVARQLGRHRAGV